MISRLGRMTRSSSFTDDRPPLTTFAKSLRDIEGSLSFLPTASMKLLSPFLASFIVVTCYSCSSEQTSRPLESSVSESVESSNLSDGTPVTAHEANGASVRNTTGITPMDVTRARPTASTPTNASTADPKPSQANIPKILGDGKWEVRELSRGQAAPGEGPRGPDGKVIDPQTYLKQLEERKAQEAANSAPQPQSRPPQVPNPVTATRTIKRLDASEAPQFPKASATEKPE